MNNKCCLCCLVVTWSSFQFETMLIACRNYKNNRLLILFSELMPHMDSDILCPGLGPTHACWWGTMQAEFCSVLSTHSLVILRGFISWLLDEPKSCDFGFKYVYSSLYVCHSTGTMKKALFLINSVFFSESWCFQ